MSSRFASNMLLLLAGAFLVAAALGFEPAVTGWLALGVGALVLLAVMAAFAFRGRGPAQRAFDVLAMVTAAWTIVASQTFSGAALRWIVFGDGALLAATAATGLVVHEVVMELALRRLAAQDAPIAVARPRLAEDEQRLPVGVAL